MATPTAIPHSDHSAHHQPAERKENIVGSNLSRSPTDTSPRSLISPIYTQAGRSAFSMPGPNSASTSPTTTTWYSAGFATSGNSQRVRSPTAGTGPVSSAVPIQRDTFPESRTHLRSTSFGSASNASTSSEAEPITPKVAPLGTSYEQIKNRRDSWSFPANAPGNRWSGLTSLRERTATTTAPFGDASSGTSMESMPSNNSTPMGGLLRKFSIGSGQAMKSPPMSAPAVSATDVKLSPPMMARNESALSTQEDYFKSAAPVIAAKTRGRQNSVTNGGSQRRRPSPMGERLLMGHFNAH